MRKRDRERGEVVRLRLLLGVHLVIMGSRLKRRNVKSGYGEVDTEWIHRQ